MASIAETAFCGLRQSTGVYKMSNQEKNIHNLCSIIWFSLFDANSTIDYETRELLVNQICKATGGNFAELMGLSYTAPEYFISI